MKAWGALLVAAILIPVFSGQTVRAEARPSAAASMDRKLQHIQRNGALPHPDSKPTEFTENEINAYIAAGNLNLPAGVKSLQFHSEPGVISATARVDFDQFREGSGSSNPLLAVFTGVHNVAVVAHAHGAGSTGFVQVDSVSLDGIAIPRFALQLFVENYVQPKYPGIGLDSRFALPDRIDWATVGAHRLTVGQK